MIVHSAKWYSIIVQSGPAHANEAKQKSKTVVVYIFVCFKHHNVALICPWHWTNLFSRSRERSREQTTTSGPVARECGARATPMTKRTLRYPMVVLSYRETKNYIAAQV